MVFKKRMKRSFKKRVKKAQKKFKKMSRGSSLLTNQSRIIPQRFRTKLVYNERLDSTSSGVLAMNDAYRVNNVYDPANKSGNYGCFGYRQLTALYAAYICYGSKIEVWANSNTDAQCQLVTVVPTTTLLSGTDLTNNIDGMKYAKTGKIMSIATGGSPQSHVKNYITCEELYGLRKDEVKFDPSLRMYTNGDLINGVPFRNGIWNVICRNANPSSVSTLNVIYNIKITYYVEFYNAIMEIPPTALTQDFLDLDEGVGIPLYGALGATGATGPAGPFVTHGETGSGGNPVIFGAH